ncbi:hypothetical protein INT45_009497, partial [Circinella minor]
MPVLYPIFISTAIRKFLQSLGIPGMLSVATEWAFEVCALLTGALGKTNLAGQSIILSINSLLLMVPSALSNAVAVRIGHHAGANRPAKIQTCFTLASLMGIIAVTVRT